MSHRDLRLFYIFRLLATSYLWAPIFFFFMEERGLSFHDRMLVGALFSGIILLVEVPTGALADRFGRKVSMQLGALCMVASGLFAYFFAYDLPTFMVSETLAALSLSLCSGADSAYLYDLLAAENRSHEYGKRESAASAWHQAGTAVAYAGGGFIAWKYSLALTYLISAGVGIIAFGVASMLHEDKPQTVSMRIQVMPQAAWRGWARLMKRALSELIHSSRLAWLIGYSAVVFTLLRAAQYLYQPYLKSRDFDYLDIGLIHAGVYLAASVVAAHAYRLRKWFGDEPLLWVLLGSLAGSFLWMAPVSGPLILVLLGVYAAANGLCSPLVKPLLNAEISDSSRRATILSVESIARRGLTGLLFAGLATQSSAIYIAGGVGFAGMLVLLIYRPHLRGTAASVAKRAAESQRIAAPPLEHQ